MIVLEDEIKVLINRIIFEAQIMCVCMLVAIYLVEML